MDQYLLREELKRTFETSDIFTPDKNSRSSSIQGHLNSPITNDDCVFLLSQDNFHCRRHRTLKEKLNKIEGITDGYLTCGNPYNCLMRVLKSNARNFKGPTSDYDEQSYLRLAAESWKVHYKESLANQDSENKIDQNVEQRFSAFLEYMENNYSSEFLEMKQERKYTEHVKDTLCNRRIESGEFLHYGPFKVESDILIFQCPTHGNVLLPTVLLLSVLDNIQSKEYLFQYWAFSDFFGKYPDTISLFSIGKKVYDGLSELHETLGEKFYKIVSKWEPLLIGWIVKDPEADLGFSRLWDTTVESLEEEFPDADLLLKILDLLLPQNQTDDDIKVMLELTGISKCFGHPLLSVKESMDEVKRIGKEENVEVDQAVVDKVLAVFRRDIILEYQRIHHKWPTMAEVPQLIEKDYNGNKIPSKKKIKNYDLWYQCKFKKFLEYDFYPDTTEILKDSAAAPPMKDWAYGYDHCAFKKLWGKSKPRFDHPVNTRIITNYLESDKSIVFNLIQDRDNGWFRCRHMIAQLCRKERELKTIARSFTKQDYEQRLIQTSMEKNLSDKVFRYVQEQSMTDSEVKELNRIMSTVQSQGEEVEVFNLCSILALYFEFEELLM